MVALTKTRRFVVSKDFFTRFLSFSLIAWTFLSTSQSVLAQDPPWFEEDYYDQYNRRNICGTTPFTCQKGKLTLLRLELHPPGSYLWECRGTNFGGPLGQVQCAAPTEGAAIKPATAPEPKCISWDRNDGKRKPYLCAVGRSAPKVRGNDPREPYRWTCYNERGVHTRECRMDAYLVEL